MSSSHHPHPDEPIKSICPEPVLPTMSSQFPVCTFRFTGGIKDGEIDPREAAATAAHALKENPRNPSVSPPVKNPVEGQDNGPPQLAMWTSKLWALGRTLNVGYLEATRLSRTRSNTLRQNGASTPTSTSTFQRMGLTTS